MRFCCLILIFLVAGYIIGYYGDICYACMARKKYLLDKLGLEVKDKEEPCGPQPYEEGNWKCVDGGWTKLNTE